ncbi:MAG TPA: hypothetical protein DCF71_08985 [Gemmatimonadetes bacterium]|nr:hypothetical protein [Gemmatimonadota bacterium]
MALPRHTFPRNPHHLGRRRRCGYQRGLGHPFRPRTYAGRHAARTRGWRRKRVGWAHDTAHVALGWTLIATWVRPASPDWHQLRQGEGRAGTHLFIRLAIALLRRYLGGGVRELSLRGRAVLRGRGSLLGGRAGPDGLGVGAPAAARLPLRPVPGRHSLEIAFHETCAIGLASAGKDTEGSQFFLAHTRLPHLDGGYTVFGWVVEGLGVMDSIMRGDQIVTASVITSGWAQRK